MTTPESPASPPSRVQRARRLLLGLLAIVLLVDLLLASADQDPRHTTPIDDAHAARAMLAELATHAPSPEHEPEPESASVLDAHQSWLLLGDSVLVGDTGKDSLPDWDQRRVIDYLEAERGVAERERVDFAQLAYSGLLPIDMLALVHELDRQDPEGRVSLLVQLSPRHFAPSYAEQRDHSRPWFASLAGSGDPWVERWHSLLAKLGQIAPVYRHRDRFTGIRETLAGFAVKPPEAGAEASRMEANRMEALARLRVHYREPRLDPESVQVAALLELVERCRAHDRRVVLFTTPVEDRFLAGLQTELEQGRYVAALDHLLEPDGEQVRLLPLDHPMFGAELFWDHVHLRPEGNRLLAINLLHQLGVGLERVPTAEQLIADEGFDASLVARIELGFEDGASWQARFAKPSDLALDPDGGRLIVVDTDNHVLRELHGEMRVVSTLAGVAGEAGDADGVGAEARFSSPRSAAFVGEDLYVADAKGATLRRVRGRSVETLASPEGHWRIAALRAEQGQLYALELQRNASRIVALDQRGNARELVRGGASPESRLTALALDPAHGLYFATEAGQIWRVDLGRERLVQLANELDTPGLGLELRFANQGTSVLPQGKGESFPFAFDKIRITEVADMVWVERYGVLLVQDLAPHPKRGEFGNHVTERVMLRVLDFDEQLIYPWLEPLVSGHGNFHFNKGTRGFSSYFHEGSLVLDQRSAGMYYLERERSRLLRLDDGLLGVAQTNEVYLYRLGSRSPLTMTAGKRSFERFVPERHFGSRRLPLARRGPYTALLLGSSVTTGSDIVGPYSLGRRIAEHLAFDLGVRDRVELELFQRMTHGGSIDKQLLLAGEFLDQGGAVDLLIFESNASLFLPADTDEAAMLDGLDAMIALARRSDAALILLDTSPYIIRNRDGPRAIPEHIKTFFTLARARGVEVVEVGDLMLAEQLRTSPFGSPPMDSTHMAPWAIDATARRMAASMSAFVRAQLRGRVPAYTREVASKLPDRYVLDRVFTEVEYAWAERLPRVPMRGLQVSFEAGVLHVFIDLGQLSTVEGSEGEIDLSDLDELTLASLHELLVRQRYGAAKVELQIGRFANYDEYGEGVSTGVTLERRETIGRTQLLELATAYAARG